MKNLLGDGFFIVVYVVVKVFEDLFLDKLFRMVNFCFDDNIIVYLLFLDNGNKNYRVGRVVEVVFGKYENIYLDFVVIKVNESRNEGKYYKIKIIE